MPEYSIIVGRHTLHLEGDLATFTASLSSTQLDENLHILRLKLASPAPQVPPSLRIRFDHPLSDIHATWHPNIGRNRGMNVSWGQPFTARVTSSAPVICLHSLSGQNRLTFAASDALNALALMAGVVEETGELICTVKLFCEPQAPISEYTLELRIDTRDLPYHESLRQVARWWEQQPGYTPTHVPELARLPMYSTWYSMHQTLIPADVVEQCRLAKSLGCEAVIVDDGWQTLDAQRGYAFTGDWLPERIPDMKKFVDDVHAAGHKFILWYGVPQMGFQAKAFPRFADKLLFRHETHKCGYLDPRFPDVRDYLITLYENAMKNWSLDGLKLDFVNSFFPTEESAKQLGNGRDFDSVSAAADRLMSDINSRLKALNPDVLIEFRQSYVGPLMRKYGNMFRAGDCPNDAITNRHRTIDIRLLAGNTATHADMIMWHPSDPVESAALQLLNVLFSVPQISVLLHRLPSDHHAMLKFWLTFWKDWRDVLLDGHLEPFHPESLYTVIRATHAHRRVVALYDEVIAPLGDSHITQLALVNATRSHRIVVESLTDLGNFRYRTFTTTGELLSDGTLPLSAGITRLAVPPAGLILLSRE